MADDGPNPAVQARRLRTELRRARLAAGVTQEQVAAAMDWSLSKIIRIENGSVGVSIPDVKAMLGLYQVVDGDRVDDLVALARGAKKRTWWDSYRQTVPQRLLKFIEYESAASSEINFQPLLVPGLLQTEEYARTSIGQLDPRLTHEQVEARVDIRMRRQELLQVAEPPRLHFVVGEAVVRHEVGGKGVMRRQIHSLIDIAGKRYVTIQVWPFSAGIRFGMLTPFVVIEFPDAADEDVLYLDNPMGDSSVIIRNNPDEVRRYRQAFEQLGKMALEPNASLTYLGRVADEMA